ncbi:MAG TPA: bifunctional methylenetetrahydrofolate dehydrogenase/methenyltetrahydrofolate cyclohydrolase FolD [Pirellulales bacterium]|mgnify:CR=1 FL=1|nr:bifunctional methylenetetrahydrofolate dehydrogenase/methenyltetrahydrofolate cyclohydrolase FolD [Pirellulales bacterium]
MSAILLDGKKLATEIQQEIAEEVAGFIANNGTTPKLAAILVGGDAASEVYVRNKQRACERVAIDSEVHRLPEDVSQDALLHLVAKLNNDESVHGILVQLPLPDAIDASVVLQAVCPVKDVDAFHPENVGRIVQGNPRFLPCTPQGIQQLLIRNNIETVGRHVVILGRSDIVGRPMANMLSSRGMGADATVTVCHSKTQDLASITRQADVLIVAIGREQFVTGEMVKSGAVVIDVGINRTDDGLIGDVDFESVSDVAGMITPVPGGVGPLTVAMLLRNTLCAAQQC